MADYKDYDELLKGYEPKKTTAQDSNKAPVSGQTPQTNRQGGANGVRSGNANNRPAPPPITSDKNNFRGGVYFSNPPKPVNGDSNRAPAQGNAAASRANNSRRRATVPGSQKAGKDDSRLARFFKSKGFQRFGIMLGVVAVVSIILCVYGIGCINDVLGITKDNATVAVSIEQGMSDEEVIDVLADNGLINNPMFCKLFIKFFEKDGPYITNTYTLSPGMGVERMIAVMKTDYTSGEVVTLTFPEGWTAQQIADKLEANEVCTAASFVAALQTVDFSTDYEFLVGLDNRENRFRVLEGYLYPDTYQFYVGENPSSVIKRFLDNFEVKWTEEFNDRAVEMNMTIDEVVILASIIQAEAANDEQMTKVSSVLHNRLDNTSTFPMLECDSTTAYYNNYIDPAFSNTSEDLMKCEIFEKNYDTYNQECTGLPVGAISNPGGDAIYAALYPEDTGYYFFNHDVNGGIYYAATVSEHDRNVAIAESVEAE